MIQDNELRQALREKEKYEKLYYQSKEIIQKLEEENKKLRGE